MVGRRTAAGLFIIVIAMSSVMGCVVKDPSFWESPISRLPRIIVDHIDHEPGVQDHTKIYVTGVGDHRYKSMNITLAAQNGTILATIEDDFIYSLSISTPETEFDMYVVVRDMDGKTEMRYEYIALVQIFHDPDVLYTVWERDPKTPDIAPDEPKRITSNPWRTILDRVD